MGIKYTPAAGGGDITSVTAGVGLSGGNTSGDVTVTFDISELSTVTPANGDFFATLDSDGSTEQKTTTTALATLLAGTGLTASSAVIGVDAAQTQITSVGTIGTGVWQGTAIASAYIAADAITGAKIADDAIDSEHYTNGSIDNAHLAADAVTGAKIADDAIDSEHYANASIDFAHIQDVAANSILGRNANSSGVLSEVALATTQILIGDGTGFTAAALSGDATMTNAGVVSLAAAQTNVNSLLATDIVIGEDAQTQIDFETANEIHFDADNAEIAKITSTGLTMSADEVVVLSNEGKVQFTDTTFGDGNQRSSGVTFRFTTSSLAVAIGQPVHLSGTGVILADADVGSQAAMPCIGVAASATTGSGTENIEVLVLGAMRYDTYNFTVGGGVFVSATAGALTTTAPSTDGHYVQKVGIGMSADILWVQPSLDVIEHA